ncbi:hypothetical protein B9G55_03745 [Saccharibacillus sp. O16]|nr:hypothetical protein B9G55_03745 [Saccharibacillus sp. O16]
MHRSNQERRAKMSYIAYLYAYAAVGLFLVHGMAQKRVLNEEELRSSKKEYLSQTEGYRVYGWGLGIGGAVAALLWLMDDFMTVSPLFFILLTLIFAFRAYMEQKYIPHTRKHRVSWITAAAGTVISIIFFIIWIVYFR